MNWKEKLKYRFPNIEEQHVKAKLPKTNAKYSLLLVPKNIDPKHLLNLKCSLTKEANVTLNKKEYVFEPLPKKPDPILINLNGPRLVELQSVITLQQSIPKLTLQQLNISRREDIPLPNAIKVRHPLFGVNYKPKLSLNKNVKRKLQEAIEHKRKIEEKEERKRRKSKRKNKIRGVEENVLNIFNSINSHTEDIKNIDLFPIKTEDNTTDLNSSSKSKHKKKKHREHLIDQSIGENESFDSAKKKHKNKKSISVLETSQNSYSDDGRKSKKLKSESVWDQSLEKSSKKKKHTKHP